jgi:hypothetical protein
MALDDAVAAHTRLENMADIMIIRPTTSGEEWTIHNIYMSFGRRAELHRIWDPTGFDSGIFIMPLSGSLLGQYNFHCTNTEFLMIVNNDVVPLDVGYDGVVTGVS